jgi:hypothetical protein
MNEGLDIKISTFNVPLSNLKQRGWYNSKVSIDGIDRSTQK